MRIIEALKQKAMKNSGLISHEAESTKFPDESDEEYNYRMKKLSSYGTSIPNEYYDEFYVKKGRGHLLRD